MFRPTSLPPSTTTAVERLGQLEVFYMLNFRIKSVRYSNDSDDIEAIGRTDALVLNVMVDGM